MTEKNTSLGLNWYETNYRSLDPQLGRFWQVDPLADMSFNYSPYVFANNNPILLTDRLGLKADSGRTTLPEIVVTAKRQAQSAYNWFTGANVGYTGSGWGHGPRRLLAKGLGANGTASNLVQLGLNSQLQSNQVQLTGGLLDKIKSDPDMIAFQNKIIALIKADPRFKNLQFVLKGGEVREFGGKRWTSPTEDWGAKNRNNPALHFSTWDVGASELTWATRHASVDYTANVKSDGTMVISYHLSDRLDLSAQPGRSEAYNNISSVTGTMYHDVAGGNSDMKINADWQTTVK